MKTKKAANVKHIMKNAAANALLLAIALGLFLALGLREGGSAPVNAGPPAIPEGLSVSTAVYRGRRGSDAALLIAASWDASALDGILRTLERAKSKVTFAVNADFALEDPRTLMDIAAAGHEIAVCAEAGYEEKSAAELKAELERAADLTEGVLGRRPELVYAGMSDKLCRAARAAGLSAVRGSIDLICERGTPAELLARARGNISGGDIVICAPTAAFEAALADILNYFSSVGLTAATVSGIIYD